MCYSDVRKRSIVRRDVSYILPIGVIAAVVAACASGKRADEITTDICTTRFRAVWAATDSRPASKL
jgi:hypothetical protein